MIRSKTIQEHLEEPHISIVEHVDSCIRALGRSLSSRKAIYLDTCFWIYLRGAIGHGNGSKTGTLLDTLRERVAQMVMFCPISDSIFVEVMKQTDPKSRSATAALIDELSLGVTLVSEQDRAELEVGYFVKTCAGRPQSPPLDEMVWSKLAYIMGMVHPHNTQFDLPTELAIQKTFFDYMWTRPMSRMVDAVADVEIPGSDWSELSNKLNVANAAHAGSLRSYRQTYKAEVRGIVDLMGDAAVAAFIAVSAEMGAPPGQMTTGMRKEIEIGWKNIIATKMEEGTAQSQLASLHIPASLHASLRWNKQQKLASNDIFDFQHATAAVAYCDAFFTERSLSNMIKQNHLRLDREFDCFVTSDVGEALAWVEGVGSVRHQAV